MSLLNHELNGSFENRYGKTKERFTEARKAFTETFLGDDASAAVVLALRENSEKLNLFPLPESAAVELQPTVSRNDDGSSTMGIRVDLSSTSRQGGETTGSTLSDTLWVANTHEDSELQPTDELMELLDVAGLEKDTATGVVESWQLATQVMYKNYYSGNSHDLASMLTPSLS